MSKAAKSPKIRKNQKPAKTGKPAGRSRTRPGSAGKRLTPAKQKRGLEAAAAAMPIESPELASLVEAVTGLQGAPLGAYRDPLGGHALLLAVLPLEAIEPTPFQRDLSPAHVKRLGEKIGDSGAFLDPVIAVRGEAGRFWTPNGRHRLAAAKLLGMRAVTALISADPALAFKILALNTEKAHNTKDRSLEVIRMAQSLARTDPRGREQEYAAAFELPAYLTLGLCYQSAPRFAGGAYLPFVRRVDRYSEKPLPAALRERQGYAARLLEIEELVKGIVAELQKRDFRSPYLRAFVVARINPVRFVKQARGETAPAMPMGAALTRMTAAARRFDAGKVRERDLALVAAVAPSEPEAD
jgi:ParB family transcriptional regulator, chromosome partitioning protein